MGQISIFLTQHRHVQFILTHSNDQRHNRPTTHRLSRFRYSNHVIYTASSSKKLKHDFDLNFNDL